MVKRRKTTKPGGLAALKRSQRRPSDDDFEPVHYDPHRVVPPGWKPHVPPRAARVGGPPLQDPNDRRSERYAMRLHPDLRAEIATLARGRGWKVSQWIEKALIDAVNGERGGEVLDQIGRYTNGKP